MNSEYFEYQNRGKLLSGKNAIDHIAYELNNMMCKKPLIITDKMLVKFGHVNILLKALKEGDIDNPLIYDDVPADSSVEVCNAIASIYRENECDCLIALGGGSVLDTSKGVNLTLSSGADNLLDIMGLGIIQRKTVPSIMIPTTSGTGSEATLVAVIADKLQNVKMEFISYNLVPDVAILDPRMTLTLPPKLTAATGFDALVHAIEAYTCKQKNPISDVFAIRAIKFICDNLIRGVVDGKDEDARLALANASYMAGTAFSNSMVGMVHAIGHALGGVCHIPHGYAMSILLPYCMEYNYDAVGNLYGELLQYFVGIEETAVTPRNERGKRCIEEIREMLKKLNEVGGLPIRLRDVNVSKDDFEKIVENAINDGAAIVNYRNVSKEAVFAILNQAY
ncbi:iron-containing alcohol dehydrogenase [Vallitalea guaymasensis]|uniref:Iron-containing alcohol dehydrogenase n=1 Tax=Vallitalea guaymasensis TaxID=1185412 RepID=A0A8J8SDR1_9FIRM|nr:iron-containing alcohol dehydrogenase [Vallitalea guaymasensis]QUH31087.1 iron-containing alcohol dehydrogenase [Vallitalea guaymasensis]